MTIEQIYNIFTQYPIVTTDSRNCLQGSVFFALKGENFNGNTFVKQALKEGCAYAITDEKEYATDAHIILVDDCLQTLQQLASFHRKQMGTPVIGITGTNGKTTTKELVASVLSTQYNTLYTQGNLNNHIGVPLTLLQLTPEHEIAIVEMGANHPGEIKFLSELTMPDYGLITNVGKAHLEGFGSFEGVVKTKGELYEYIRKTKGNIFIHKENPFLAKIATDISLISYGYNPDSFIWGEISSLSPFVSLEWRCKEETYTIDTQLIGAYNLDNILSAIAIGKFMGITPQNICTAISEYTPRNNRSQLKDTGKNRLIIDTYNANPTSMLAALESFRDIQASPKALILGDMKELGDASSEEHQKIVDFIRTIPVEKVFLCGSCFKETDDNPFETFVEKEALHEQLKKDSLQGYYILIKGSRSMQLEKTIEFL